MRHLLDPVFDILDRRFSAEKGGVRPGYLALDRSARRDQPSPCGSPPECSDRHEFGRLLSSRNARPVSTFNAIRVDRLFRDFSVVVCALRLLATKER